MWRWHCRVGSSWSRCATNGLCWLWRFRWSLGARCIRRTRKRVEAEVQWYRHESKLTFFCCIRLWRTHTFVWECLKTVLWDFQMEITGMLGVETSSFGKLIWIKDSEVVIWGLCSSIMRSISMWVFSRAEFEVVDSSSKSKSPCANSNKVFGFIDFGAAATILKAEFEFCVSMGLDLLRVVITSGLKAESTWISGNADGTGLGFVFWCKNKTVSASHNDRRACNRRMRRTSKIMIVDGIFFWGAYLV